MVAKWVQIDLDAVGETVFVSSRTSAEGYIPRKPLARGMTLGRLRELTAAVAESARLGEQLDEHTLAEACELHEALVDTRLDLDTKEGKVLFRFNAVGPELRSVPWEVACIRDASLRHWGTTADRLTTRGVATDTPMPPREIQRDGLKLLAISHLRVGTLEPLREAVRERVAAGEMKWLPELVPPEAHIEAISPRLGTMPNVIHFVGHGTATPEPMLQIGEDPSEEGAWIRVGTLAEEIKANNQSVRLFVLESCDGAKQGDLASAAEILASVSGVDAVIAHLWPVRADIARLFSKYFYRTLVSEQSMRGDVAASLQAARRWVYDQKGCSAEAFSPVLYLRSNNPVLFDLSRVRASPPGEATSTVPVPPPTPGPRAVPPLIEGIVGRAKGFSLLLGDRWKHDDMWQDSERSLEAFRKRLIAELVKRGGSAADADRLPTSALMERVALLCELSLLDEEFQGAFKAIPPPPLVASVARVLPPGVHVTLLRLPHLEHAIASAAPNASVYVIQPSDRRDEPARVFHRAAGAGPDGWEPQWDLEEVSRRLDFDHDFVVVRPYRGYTPDVEFSRPMTTEDHYLFELETLAEMLPHEQSLQEAIQGQVSGRPWLIMGVSLVPWNHRKLLHGLFESTRVPSGSVVVVSPQETEEQLWKRGRGLPASSGVPCVAATAKELGTWLDAMPSAHAAQPGA